MNFLLRREVLSPFISNNITDMQHPVNHQAGKPQKNGAPITENVPIYMRVVFASQCIEFTTGYRIDAAKWDADKQRVKNGCTNKLKQCKCRAF